MDRMEKCIASVKRNFTSIRTGRASPDMLDRVMVNPDCLAYPLRLPLNLNATNQPFMRLCINRKVLNISLRQRLLGHKSWRVNITLQD